jgi:hypothetical protein
LSLAFVLGTASACGDPTGTNSGDPLTNEEIAEVLSVLSETFGSISAIPNFSLHGQPAAEAPVAFRTVPVNADFNESAGCPAGGNISLEGSVDGDVDDETFVGSIDVELTWDFNSCAVTTETTTITLNGDPHITFEGSFDFSETTFEVSGTEKGGFSYTAADGRAGSCAIDVTFSSSVNTATNAVNSSFSGTVCGQTATGL